MLAGFSLATVISISPVQAASPPDAITTATATATTTATATATATATTTATTTATATATIDVALGFYGLLRPGEDLGLTLTVTNSSAATIGAGTAQVFLGSEPVTSHRSLAEWFSQPTGADALGNPVVQLSTPALLPGEAVTLPGISVPAATLGITAVTSPGARKLAVRVLAGSTPVAEYHSSVTTVPAPLSPARLAIAMPLVLPADSAAVVSADLLAQYTSPTGFLTRQLDQAYATPVAIGIDPRILASIRILGSSTPESAVLWLARLQSAPNTTFALSFGDSDISGTSQAGIGLLSADHFVINPTFFTTATPTVRPPSAAPSPSPSGTAVNPALPSTETLLAFPYSLSAIAWPRENSVIGPDLDTFAAAGLTTTILASGNSSLATTSAGATATINKRAILNSDDEVSSLLRDAVEASTETSWQSAMARLNSTLAAISSDNPVPTRVTLATLARTPGIPTFRLGETLNALATMAWTTPTSLATAFAEKSVNATIEPRPVDPSRLESIKQLLSSEASVAQFSAILSDPAALTAERRLSLLALTAQTWQTALDGWAPAVTEYLNRSTALVSAVRVVNSSTINLLSDKGQLPITVNNALPYPVTVYVNVRSPTAVLDIQEPRVKLTVEANSQNRAFVPVQSIANGEVTISVGLLSATGLVVGQQALATINVQAGWETGATAVLAILLLFVFILGIIRTVRRRRRLAVAPTE